jgi:hypothetical protein
MPARRRRGDVMASAEATGRSGPGETRARRRPIVSPEQARGLSGSGGRTQPDPVGQEVGERGCPPVVEPPREPASATSACMTGGTPRRRSSCPKASTRGWSWSCSATAGCARRWTSTATSCRRWPGRQPTAWARCCSQVRVGGLQLQLQPETTQAALPRGNGLVNGVELRNW